MSDRFNSFTYLTRYLIETNLKSVTQKIFGPGKKTHLAAQPITGLCNIYIQLLKYEFFLIGRDYVLSK